MQKPEQEQEKSMPVGAVYDKITFRDDEFPFNALFNIRLSKQTVAGLGILKWHEEIELKYYLKGGSELQLGNENRLIEDGDIIFVNPCEVHRTVSAESTTCYHSLMISPQYLEQIVNSYSLKMKIAQLTTGELTIHHVIRNSERAKNAVRLLFEELGRLSDGNKNAVIGLIIYLFSILFEEQSVCRTDNSHARTYEKLKKIRPALTYINEHYQQDISLKELADMCYFSTYYFSKVFKEVMHITVLDYIHSLRIDSAKVLLTTTDKKLGEIAAICGFDDPCYFSRWFKKSCGVSADKYRRMKRCEDQKQ